jgi:hypothetical protein
MVAFRKRGEDELGQIVHRGQSRRDRGKRRRQTMRLLELLEARCLLAITSTTPIPISETEAISFTDNVMHFTANDAGPFTATIAWGDLATSPGTITPSPGGGFDVSGTHTYAEDGSYTVTVIITDTADNTSVAPTTTATIGEQLLSLSAQNFSVPENSTATVLVATASDPGSPDPGSDFTATIDWGDGSATTAGTVTATGGGNFNITGSHAYADEGSHTVTTTFFETSQAGFGTLSVSGTGTVTEADSFANGAITLPSGTFVEGQAIPAGTQVATFSDPGYPTNSASDFTALINWGDGTPATAGTVVALGGGNFGLEGGHTYAEEGSFTIAATVADDAPGTATTTITGSVVILNAPLTGTAVTLHGTEGAPLTNVDVATFVDADPLGDANDMVATIDWGDGTVTAGTVVQDAQTPPGGGTMFHVQGSHTYSEENPAYPVTVTVIDRGDPDAPITGPLVSTVTINSTAVIVQSPLLPVSNQLVSTEGTAIPAGTQLATFTDTGGADPIGDYTATINWGDGSGVHPAGVIALGQGNFAVVSNGAFTYPDEGTFALTVAVTDADTTNNPGGVPTTAQTTATATVNDAALTASATQPVVPATGTLNEGTSFTGAVASFTDANTGAPLSDYTALIDWGDGTGLSLGSFTSAAGVVTVNGTHTYKQDGVYTIKVAITDDGGSTLNTTTTATVGDPNLTGATAVPVKAVEGQDTGLVYLASFIDPDPNATLRDWNAVVHWGDGSPDETATLVIAGGDPATGGTIFKVLASHTYAEEGPPTAPTVTITDVDTPANAPTVLPLNITVVDARLSSSNGTELTGFEGSPTAAPTTPAPPSPGLSLLGSFTDANPGGTISDFTPTIDWGGPGTVNNPGVITQPGGAGTPFLVWGSYTYNETGTYAVTVTVTDTAAAAAGVVAQSTTISDSAIIADATLSAVALASQPTVSADEPTTFPIPEFGPPPTNNPGQQFSGPVAYFTDANPVSTIADFTATIDWGDGTPPTAGTIGTATVAGATVYSVSGIHTYADAGTGSYSIQVFVVDDDGSRLTLSTATRTLPAATVTDNPISVIGTLNPKSDSGLSTGTPDVTNVTQPDFFGTVLATLPGGTTVPEPYATVTLTATSLTSGVATTIGQVEAGSDGSWNIKSQVALPDDTYAITATAIDQFGRTTTTAPATITPSLLVDTTGPVITGMFFNRLNGQIDYTIQDPTPPSPQSPLSPPGAPVSGVWVNTLLDSSNYLFTKVHANKAYPGKWIVTNVTVTPDAVLPNAYDVVVTLNSGKPIRGGFYLFTIRDSSNGNSSVQDLAENHLDGVFYGTFPSGNGINGSDFVAELDAFHNKIFAPQTIIGTASPGNGGVGGPPVGAVHSGHFLPVVPRDPKPHKAAKPAKSAVVSKPIVKARPIATVVNTKAHDAALTAIVAQKTGRRK